jgi:hypothetical protein
MKTIERQVECPECYGKGTLEYGPECYLPASMCCGGCYKTVTCEYCDGTGEMTQTGTEWEATEIDDEELIEWHKLVY